jgi:hypothetical protein
MVAQVNITVETDADFFQVFQYLLPDNVTPISIVNATFTFGVRRTLSDTSVLFKVTSAGGTVALNGSNVPNGQIQIIDGPNGKFGLWISMAQLQAAPTGTWAHSLIITQPPTSLFPPTLNTPIWNGTLTINPGPAR